MIIDNFKSSLILPNHTETTIVTPLKTAFEASGETYRSRSDARV